MTTGKAPSRPPARAGYQCEDCSHTSSRGFPGGRCPGCGSFRIRRLGEPAPVEPPPARRSFRLALLVALWLLLAWKIWNAWLALG